MKKKVRQKYSESYDFESISNLLGMEKTSFSSQETEESTGIISLWVPITYKVIVELWTRYFDKGDPYSVINQPIGVDKSVSS